jgi:hypothetical protein
MTMQIIIIQSEIEQAIRNHILAQINIKDGMRIDIDLSATRGAEGFKATIDIVADTQPVTGKAEVVTKPTNVEVRKEDPAPKAPEVSQGKEAQEPSLPESGVLTDGAGAAEAGTAQTASAEPSSTEPQAEEQPAEPKPAGRSLFNGLKRVNNG